MQAIIADESYKDSWEKFVEETPRTITWHAYDWYKVVQAHHPVKYYPLAAVEGDEVVGILPLYRMKKLRGSEFLISIPYFVAGGIVGKSAEARLAIFEKAVELSKEFGSLPIILKQYSVPVEHEDLQTDDNYFNLELDLSVGEEAVWAGLDEANRQAIKESEQWNLELDYPSSDFNTFNRMLMDHHHRAGIPFPSRGWVKSLVDDAYDIAFLRKDGKIVTATLAKKFKDSISFPLTSLGGDSPEYTTYTYRLYWELLKKQIADGVRIFHSGRIPESRDVPVYRLGWGGDRQGYYYQYYGFSGKTEGQTKSSKNRQRFETVWRMVPKPIQALVNPIIVRQFP